jgi:DNA repair protein RecO (recombination protein O)
MEWQDEAIVLAVRRHAENDAIVSALTLEHGRHAGLVHGGAGKRAGPLLQPGNRSPPRGARGWPSSSGTTGSSRCSSSRAAWSTTPPAPRARLGLRAARGGAAERESHPRLYAGLLRLLETMVQNENKAWPETYVRFELLLLSDLGFGLDLASCAVTGTGDDLAFVSPRSGRAVSRERPGPFARAPAAAGVPARG